MNFREREIIKHLIGIKLWFFTVMGFFKLTGLVEIDWIIVVLPLILMSLLLSTINFIKLNKKSKKNGK
jgi:hypothetical protein